MSISGMWELVWEHVYQPISVHDGGIVASVERGRDPCWWRAIDECGIGFIFGTVIGLGVNTWQGHRMSGPGRKLRVIRDRLVTRVPLAGGNFAAWTTAFALAECTMVSLRGGAEDLFNPTIAGGVAGAFTSSGGGRRAMIAGAKRGAMLLGFMELAISTYTAYSTNLQLGTAESAPPPPPAPADGEPDPRMNRRKRLQEFQWVPKIRADIA